MDHEISILLNENTPDERRVVFAKRNLIEIDITDEIAKSQCDKKELEEWLKKSCLLHNSENHNSIIKHFLYPIPIKEMVQNSIVKLCPEWLLPIFQAAFQAGKIQYNATGDPGYVLIFWFE